MMKGLSDNILQNFLTGNCTEQELDIINAFIHESEENAQQLFLMEELFHLGKLDTFATDEHISHAQERLFERIKAEEASNKRKSFITGWRKYAALIAVVLFVGGGVGYWYNSTGLDQKMITEIASAGVVEKIVLPDGTKVWLNNGTTLKYPAKLSGKERRVYIEGEAYFEVTKDAQRPFIVSSDAMQIKVLGTSFNFRNNKSCGIAKTSLIEGEIEVKGNNNEGMIILNPGQRAELNKNKGQLTVKQVNTRLDAVWKDYLIPFDNANLYTIGKTLERLYKVKVILAPGISTDITYSGVIRKQSKIESALNSLRHSIPFSYNIAEDKIFISPIEER